MPMLRLFFDNSCFLPIAVKVRIASFHHQILVHTDMLQATESNGYIDRSHFKLECS